MLLNTKRRRSGPWRIGAAALAALVLLGVYISRNGSLESVPDTSPAVQEDTRALLKADKENALENDSQVVTGVIEKETAIDYQALENNEDLRRLMEARKKKPGDSKESGHDCPGG